jgi:hypothetical protein
MNRDYLLSIAVVAVVLSAFGCPGRKGPEQAAAPQKPPPKITQFYAAPSVVAPGESAQLCFGVEHADQLRMEPPVANVRPAFSRCVQVTLKRTSTYTLIASNEKGQATATISVSVDPHARRAGSAGSGEAKPSSLSFFADRQKVAPGQPVLLCYQAGAASKVDVQPRSASGALPATGCITERPSQTTNYVLTAEFADGRREKQELTIRVE